ncbi:MAG: chemotaxis protein CheB [Actinomycetes bacterium]
MRRVVERLPAELPAAVVVVMHLHPTTDEYLPSLLDRAGPLPVRQPLVPPIPT